MKNYLIWLAVPILILGCRNKFSDVPGNVIPPKKFTEILTDIRLAEANHKYLHQQGLRKDQLLDSSYHVVYSLHGVTEEKVIRSYTFYVMHPEWMDKITVDVIDQLNHLER